MRIPWRRLFWMAVVAIPLAVAIGIGWSSISDLSRYQARLADQIRKATGRELVTRVPLSVRLGREPALVAEGVTLSNASWASRPELASVRRLTLFLDPLALMLGEAKVGRILLEGADIQVEHNVAGDSNLEMLPPPQGSGPHPRENRSLRQRPDPAFPWIGVMEIRDSALTVQQGRGRGAVVLEIAQAVLKANAPNQTLQADARIGVPGGARFDVAGGIGSFDGWMRGLPGNIDLQGSFGDGRIAIKGSIGSKGTSLQVTADGPDVGVFGPYVQLPVPAGGPYALSAKAGTFRSTFKVDLLSLKVGDSELSGEALFRTDRQGTPTVTVNADAPRLDMAWLRGARNAPLDEAPQVRGPTQAPARFLPSMPFSASWLGRSTLSATVRVGELVGLSGKLQNGSMTLASSDRRFTLRAAASLGQGSAGFDLVYDPSGRIGQATLSATANRVSLEDISALLGLDLGLRGAVADIDLRLRGGGRSARDALNVASGTIEVAVAKGVWPSDGLVGWPVETQRLLAPTEAGAAFNCLAGRFDVSGGIANLRRFVVDTPRATWVGGGYAHLRNESWEFILAPEARDPRGIPLAIPLRLQGGTGKQTAGNLEPNLSRLLVGAGTVPSLVSTYNQIARQAGINNGCAAMLARVDGLRPGLRAQLPVPPSAVRRPARR